jgi:hypothetical protein
MKRLLLIIGLILILVSSAFAAGTATVTSAERFTVLGDQQRVVLTITWTDDTAGTTLAINPATYRIQGFYLWSGETNPGATAPTTLYDITLVDADGVDIAEGKLMNRHATTSELVKYINHCVTSTFTFTLSGNAVVNGTGTLILTFTAN